jgi:L-ascorbate metabolism protein UlaG (beta-lactamase superfamily)
MTKITSFTFAGHSAVIFNAKTDASEIKLAIDPWLEGNPSCPDSLKNIDLDLIVLTHGHADHAGDVLRLCKNEKTKVGATYELAMLLVKNGVKEENVIPMNKGGSVDVDGLKISLTHAMHSNSFDAVDGTHYAGEACGVVISDSDNTYYHAGDTALFSDMKLIKETYKPNFAFIPIGDRFTMGPKEAFSAVELIEAKNVVPIHHSTFPLLTGTVTEFKSLLSLDTNLIDLNPGENYEV